MKKLLILIGLIISITFNYIYAYTLSTSDTKLVENTTKKIETIIYKKGENYRARFIKELNKLGIKYSENEQIKNIINEIILSIDKQKNTVTNNNYTGEQIIFAVGGDGGTDTGKQIDDSGSNAMKIDLYINYIKKPVVLILGGYNPTIWNISISEGTTISKIILGGYNKQVITGIDKNFSNIEKHIFQDGDENFFTIQYDTLKSSLKKFGNVEKIYLDTSNSGKIVIGENDIKNIKWIKNNNNKPEDYFKSEDELSGPAGIEMLVKKGFLRDATEDDADKWFNAIINNENSFLCKNVGCPITDKDDLKVLKGKYTPSNSYNHYVALKDFTIPAGLYGSFSSNFYIPKGISYKGDPGHSNIYNFNNLECIGVMCPGSY